MPLLWIDSVIIIAVNAIALLMYNYCNKNNDMLRYFHKHNKNFYYAATVCYAIIIISFIFNVRYFVSHYMKQIVKFLKRLLL